jgi:hypothetical protein
LGAVSLSGQVTVTNNGSVATDLTVNAFLEQKGTGSQWNMVRSIDTVQVLSADQNQVLVQAFATVKVNVWSLDIAKAVTGASFTRTYNWSLGKPDPASLKVHVGEQASYSVPVTVTATDSGWKVEGTITIHNPAPSRPTSPTCAAGTATSPNSYSIQVSIRIVMFLAQNVK